MLTILFYCLLFVFRNYFLIGAVIAQIFNPIVLPTPVGLPTKEAKAEMEAHQVILKPKIRNFSICFSKRYDIIGFSNFLYLSQITQYNF